LLSERYFVGTGFAFDAQDNISRQLDIVIASQPPFGNVFQQDGICKLPCEVVLAVIEVKKVLRLKKIKESLANAVSVRTLSPYGDQCFIPGRTGGVPAKPDEHRCFYGVVALSSNLVVDDWAQKEWSRLQRIAADRTVDPHVIDRLVVLDRGIINVNEMTSLNSGGSIEPLMFEWFVHLANHLDRESRRRPPLDIDMYSARKARWVKLL
jgi:hypothetical protein